MRLEWRKSSWSGGQETTSCVEVAALAHGVAVRDSKDPDGPKLALTRTGFHAMLRSLK
jgi:uncharacterized protein DUF397